MHHQSAMSYKQLFLLILTIWSAELFTRVIFDVIMAPQVAMEFRTVYLPKDAKQNLFLGAALKEHGSRGWLMVSVQPDPDNRAQMIVFMQRQAAVRLDTPSRE